MELTQEQFNRYLLQQIIHLQAETTVLTATLKAVSGVASREGLELFESELKRQIQAVYDELLLSHPLTQDDRDIDLQSWIDRS